MISRTHVSLLLVATLFFSPSILNSQVVPNHVPVRILEILDIVGTRLGIVIVASEPSTGHLKDTETWRFREKALLGIAEQASLEFAVLAQGEWDDQRVIEALDWQPQDDAIEWSHPTTVDWTSQREQLPPASAGTYFGDPTLGGVEFTYSPRGRSSLTWFKLIEGDYVLYEGAVFERDEAPETGSWWQGPIEI